MALFKSSCHFNMEETPNMDDKKTPGPFGHTEISRNVDVKSCRRPRYQGLSQSFWCDKLKVESLYFF